MPWKRVCEKLCGWKVTCCTSEVPNPLCPNNISSHPHTPPPTPTSTSTPNSVCRKSELQTAHLALEAQCGALDPGSPVTGEETKPWRRWRRGAADSLLWRSDEWLEAWSLFLLNIIVKKNSNIQNCGKKDTVNTHMPATKSNNCLHILPSFTI